MALAVDKSLGTSALLSIHSENVIDGINLDTETDPSKITFATLTKRAEKERKLKETIRNNERQADSDNEWRKKFEERKTKPEERAYGSWESPFTSDLVTGGVELEEIAIDRSSNGKSRIYWLQRQQFDATTFSPFKKERDFKIDPYYRGTVFSIDLDAQGSARDPIEWTHAPYKVQTNVHSTQLHDHWAIRNSGGSIHAQDGSLYFTTKHNLYHAEQPGRADYLSLAMGPNWRFAEPTTAHGAVYCVHETVSLKSEDKGKPPQNQLVRLFPDRTETKLVAGRCEFIYPEMTVISDEADFYASPKVSPDGRTLVWMQWNHPNIPWHATEIWAVDLDDPSGVPLLETKRKLLGDNRICYMQPRWSSDGNLYVIADLSNWWNIYHVDIAKSRLGRNVTKMQVEIGAPMWRLGSFAQSYDFDPQSTKMAFEADGKLFIHDLSQSSAAIPIETGFVRHRSIYFGNNGDIFCIASGPTQPHCLIRYSLTSKKIEIIIEPDRNMKNLVQRQGIDWTRYVSVPEHFSISVEGKGPNDFFTGYFYSPKNDDYISPTGKLPPLIIYLHDGPTDRKTDEFDSRICYFTSRGFAWFSINYRGSSGYGRSYRDNLHGHWGQFEVEDVTTAVKYLVEKKKCDQNSIFLFGESAGGFSAMRAACMENTFCGAMVHYGYCDLVALHRRAHFGHGSKQIGMLKDADKFRAHYWSRLAGERDFKTCAKLKSLSPISNKSTISCALGIIYGLDDKLSQGGCHDYDEIWKSVKAKGFLTTMLEFYDEGHGFQKPANRRLALDGTYAYFCKLLAVEATVKCSQGDGDPKERMFFYNVPGQKDPVDTFLPPFWATAPKDHC